MDDQLITIETAILSREKGFDIPTTECFDISVPEPHTVSTTVKINWNSKDDELYSRPTQSLLNRWLRKNHKIHVKISEWELEKWYFYIRDGRGEVVKELRIILDEWEFSSYEDALEAGLKEGLKII